MDQYAVNFFPPRAVLRKYGGLWFVDESFVVERLRG
jgi:hypothetical protein